jgi:hypothetical protein
LVNYRRSKCDRSSGVLPTESLCLEAEATNPSTRNLRLWLKRKSLELLGEYAPIWYTEQHQKRALNAWRILRSGVTERQPS